MLRKLDEFVHAKPDLRYLRRGDHAGQGRRESATAGLECDRHRDSPQCLRRQIDSTIVESSSAFGGEPLEMVFIRAPRIEKVGEGVEVLAKRGNDPVLVRQGKVMAATFHPELSEDTRVHGEFLKLIKNGA